MSKTKLSSKGQVVIPRSVRDSHRLKSGDVFEIEDHPDGILLRPLQRPNVRVEDVFGCTGYKGPSKSIEEMHRAVADEARRRGRT